MVQVSSMTLAAGISGITQRTQINSEVADINSLHSGTSRPAYLTDGLWLKTTSSVLWELMYYDGNTDIVLNQINPTTHLVVAEPIAQGGTGATTAAAARTNLSAAVLGTNNDITSMTALSSINGGQLAGLRNRIINGDMRIDQRAVGAAVTITGSGYASLDRWLTYSTQSSKYSIQRITGAGPTGLFNTILKATSLSAYAPLTGDYFNILQRIEGQNIIDLGFGTANAKAITLSFWVQSTLTGTFGGTLNNASSRAFPFTYVINAANTWEYKTLIVAGDTSGTWLLDNSVGLVASFSLGCGATNLGTAGAWNSSSSLGATGQVNMVATNASTLLLTGVQLEIGSVATPFEQRPIQIELDLCLRYFEKSYNLATALGTGEEATCPWFTVNSADTTLLCCSENFKVEKRSAPTLLIYDTGAANTTGKFRMGGTQMTVSGGSFGTKSIGRIYSTVAMTAASYARFHYTVDAEL